jgi:hypothetical protein
MNIEELRPLLPEGTEIFGAESGAKYIVRIDPKVGKSHAVLLREILEKHSIESIIFLIRKEDFDIYRINEGLEGK